jgi:hypothetical protein
MATQPSYVYVPAYGIEPYAALGTPESAQTGGGAKVTQDNLIVSLWGNITFQNGVPSAGKLMKPASAFGDFLEALLPGFVGFPNNGWKTEFASRYAARFVLELKGKEDIDYPILGVMNPPAALKQRLAGALEVAASGAPQGYTVTVKKPITDNVSWNINAQSIDIEGSYAGGASGFDAEVAGVFADLPFCATDGSDGVFPTFYAGLFDFPSPTLGQVKTLIAALNRGNFFIPFEIGAEAGSLAVTINWPHSIGRG